ncbi:MAG TPA: VOC family protein [Pseudonocardia sp.]|jgi:hypothetical protein|nr:VOC family protein [Pseudonocardia sp.]
MSPLYLRQVALAVRDLDKVVESFCTVFDTEVAHVDPTIGQFGVQHAVIRLGTQYVEVLAPVEDTATMTRFIARRGEGLYMVLLQCEDDRTYRARADELGIRRILELTEEGDYRCFQMHPSDSRTSVMLEIDQQPGPPTGPYFPGGNIALPADAARDGLITGVSIPSSDADELARRWGQLLDHPVEGPPAGLAVALANAALRFPVGTPADVTIDVSVGDPPAVLARAAKIGLATSGSVVTLGGANFAVSSS